VRLVAALLAGSLSTAACGGVVATGVANAKHKYDTCEPQAKNCGVSIDGAEQQREVHAYGCELGHADACFKAALIARSDPKRDEWLRIGCGKDPEGCLTLGGAPDGLWGDEPTPEARVARIRFAAASGKPFGYSHWSQLGFGALDAQRATTGAPTRRTLEQIEAEGKVLCEAGYKAYCTIEEFTQGGNKIVDDCIAEGKLCGFAGIFLRLRVAAGALTVDAASNRMAAACAKQAGTTGCQQIVSAWFSTAATGDSKLPRPALVRVCKGEWAQNDPLCDDAIEMTPDLALSRCLNVRPEDCARYAGYAKKKLSGEWPDDACSEKGNASSCRQAVQAVALELAWNKARKITSACKLTGSSCIQAKAQSFARGEPSWLETLIPRLPSGSLTFVKFALPPEIVVNERACDVLYATWRPSCASFKEGVKRRAKTITDPVLACLGEAAKNSPPTSASGVRETVTDRSVYQADRPLTNPLTGQSWTQLETEHVETSNCNITGDPVTFEPACNACFRSGPIQGANFCADTARHMVSCAGGSSFTRSRKQ
jgi:hypothetical protein